MHIKKEQFNKIIMILLMISAILLPPIRFKAIPDVRVDLIIIIFGWLIVILSTLNMGKTLRLQWSPITKWYIFIGISICISILYAVFVMGYYPTGSDLNEFIKLLKYLLIFTFALNVSAYTFGELQKIYKITLLLFLLAAFMGFAQFFNILDINSIISPYYAPTQMRGLLVHNRITGTTANPNLFGALMLMGVAISFSGALFVERIRMKIISWLCFLIYVVAIVLTLSRSSFICLILVLVFIMFCKYTRFKIKSIFKLFVLLALMFFVALIITEIAPQKFFMRIATLRDMSEALNSRLGEWIITIHYWFKSPFVGWGPGNGIAKFEYYVDNEWLYILRSYGILGLSVFIGFFSSSYFFISKGLKRKLNSYGECFCVALQATIVAYVIYMIPAAVYNSLQLMSVFSLYLGFVASIIVNEHKK